MQTCLVNEAVEIKGITQMPTCGALMNTEMAFFPAAPS